MCNLSVHALLACCMVTVDAFGGATNQYVHASEREEQMQSERPVPQGMFGVACTVPPLACFGASPTQRMSLDMVRADFSALAYSSEDHTFFAVNNGESLVFELELPLFPPSSSLSSVPSTPQVLHEWTLPASGDPEGISWLGGRLFAVTDENPSKVMIVELLRDSASARLVETVIEAIVPAAKKNLGFEGVTYVHDLGFLGSQEDPPILWLAQSTSSDMNNANTHSQRMLHDLKATAGINTLGDVARSCQSRDEVFVLAKDPRAIHRIDLASGQSLERYTGEVCAMARPEALLFVPSLGDGIIRMIVAGEPTELFVFEAAENCTEAVQVDQAITTKCPEQDPDCTKTLAEGGCAYRRCSKSKTPNEEVCSKDAGCSLEECAAKCDDPAGFDKGGDSRRKGVCSYFAWNRLERECLLFEGCENSKLDNDYHLYALAFPPCTRTLNDTPAGCAQRRCSKDNVNAKVCDHNVDEGEGRACDVQTCRGLCVTHSEFDCVAYSFDTLNEDCYLFASCTGYGPHNQYDTYVL